MRSLFYLMTCLTFILINCIICKVLEEKLEELMKAFQEAVNEKMKCQAEADATTATIDLANRLVNGLASEKIRLYIERHYLFCGNV